MDLFSILGWILLGGIAGYLASLFMGTNSQQGCLMDIVLGIVGAMLGGWLFSMLGLGGNVSGFNIGSLIVATIGACVLILLIKFLQNLRK